MAKIRGVDLHAATDRGLAMLALRPLSVALDALGESPRGGPGGRAPAPLLQTEDVID